MWRRFADGKWSSFACICLWFVTIARYAIVRDGGAAAVVVVSAGVRVDSDGRVRLPRVLFLLNRGRVEGDAAAVDDVERAARGALIAQVLRTVGHDSPVSLRDRRSASRFIDEGLTDRCSSRSSGVSLKRRAWLSSCGLAAPFLRWKSRRQPSRASAPNSS